MDHDLLERHAHHLGRGLRDDRVAAGADVGHVGLDRDDAVAVEPDARARFHQQIVAERRRHADADQPVAVAHLARLRDCACSSRSVRRPGAGTRPAGAARTAAPDVSGSTWVSLSMRNSTGSRPSFSAISSIAISSAIMPGASPGARIALPSGRSSTASRIAVMRLAPA